MEAAAVKPDHVLPPPGPPAKDTNEGVLVGDGWKPVVGGFVTRMVVKGCEAHIRAQGFEPAPVDDDNVEDMRRTCIAVLNEYAPGVRMPAPLALLAGGVFIYADLRIAARRLPEGEGVEKRPFVDAPAESPQSDAGSPPPNPPPAPAPAPPRAREAPSVMRPPAVAARTANRFASIMPER